MSMAIVMAYFYEAFRRITSKEGFPKGDIWKIPYLIIPKFLIYFSPAILLSLVVAPLVKVSLSFLLIPVAYLLLLTYLPKYLTEKKIKEIFLNV